MNPGRPALHVSADDVPDEFALLHACLAQIPDPRHAKGKLYPQPAVLSLVVLGLMAGCRSLSDIMRYGQNHPEVLPALGCRWVPSVPTLSRVLAGVDPPAVRMPCSGLRARWPRVVGWRSTSWRWMAKQCGASTRRASPCTCCTCSPIRAGWCSISWRWARGRGK